MTELILKAQKVSSVQTIFKRRNAEFHPAQKLSVF